MLAIVWDNSLLLSTKGEYIAKPMTQQFHSKSVPYGICDINTRTHEQNV